MDYWFILNIIYIYNDKKDEKNKNFLMRKEKFINVKIKNVNYRNKYKYYS